MRFLESTQRCFVTHKVRQGENNANTTLASTLTVVRAKVLLNFLPPWLVSQENVEAPSMVLSTHSCNAMHNAPV